MLILSILKLFLKVLVKSLTNREVRTVRVVVSRPKTHCGSSDVIYAVLIENSIARQRWLRRSLRWSELTQKKPVHSNFEEKRIWMPNSLNTLLCLSELHRSFALISISTYLCWRWGHGIRRESYLWEKYPIRTEGLMEEDDLLTRLCHTIP